jgi:arylsulfatase A-like enzyme
VASQATAESEIPELDVSSRPETPALLLAALWFGIVAGLVEGWGLLLFQKINWQRWGMQIHVSWPILWISPLVDLIFFFAVSLAIVVASRLWPRIPAFRVTVFVLMALTVYDWLLVPSRLYHIACFLLAIGVGTAVSRWAAAHEAKVTYFWRRTAFVLALLMLMTFAGVRGGTWLSERSQLASLPAAAPDSPNVLVIVIDTLRADHLSSYGYARPTSPNIDRLAKEGVLFENATSAASWTYPSHVSLLTGRYPFEDGLGRVPPMSVWRSNAGIIEYPMIGEDLEKRGYRTGAFSGNRIYFDHDLGFGRGFTHFEDYFFSPADMVARTVFGKEFGRWVLSRGRMIHVLQRLGLERSLDLDAEGSGERWNRQRLWDSHPPRKRGEEVNREVLKWIGGEPEAHPFFAVLNYFDVHAPYGGPPSFLTPPWAQNQDIDKYDDGVRYADDCVGQLMAALARRNLSQNTLVVITADHGESLGEHGLASHAKSLYWDLIHVPLIIWYPGHVPSGVRVPDVVSTSFLAATLTGLVPGNPRYQFPGPSLAELWNGSAIQADAYYPLAEISYNCFRANLKLQPQFSVPTDLKGAMKSIVTDRWHLMTHKEFGDQLYDWNKDPHETHDLINTPEGRRVAQDLTGRLLNLLAGRQQGEGPIQNALRLKPAGGQQTEYVHQVRKTTRVNDYYLLPASGGTALRIDVQNLKSEPARDLDTVLTVEDAEGRILDTCRNPGDDNLPPPGTSDPTPNAFDDACVNDDVRPGVDTESRLDLLVPGSQGAQVNLYLRVSDWNGRLADPGSGYEIAVGEATDGDSSASAPPPKDLN